VLDLRKTVIHYLTTWFCLDFALVVVDWTQAIMNVATSGEASRGAASTVLTLMSYFRVLRLLRCMKMYKIIRMFEDRIESEGASVKLKIIRLFISMVILVHLIGCTWYFIGDSTGAREGEISWISSEFDMHPQGDSAGYRYATSFHWALTQFTPASISVQPTNVYERTFGIIALLFALIIISSFVSGITSALTQLRAMSGIKHKQFWLLRRFLAHSGVPQTLSIRIEKYCIFAWDMQAKTLHEESVTILLLLSNPLRAELNTAIYQPRMSQHPFFVLLGKISMPTMSRLCTTAVERVSVGRGDALFTSGQVATHMHFVNKGSLHYDPCASEKNASENDGLASASVGFEVWHEDRGSVTSFDSDVDKARLRKLRNPEVIHSGEWICEAVLWTDWTYIGQTVAITDCDLVALNAEKFMAAIFSNAIAKGEASSYSRGFMQGLNRMLEHQTTDLFQSRLVEGLWFRLLNEYNVKRGRAYETQSSVRTSHTSFRSGM